MSDAPAPYSQSNWAHLVYVLRANPVTLLAFGLFAFLIFCAVFGPSVVPYDPLETNANKALQPPSWEHWFGTDQVGRDVFSRVIVATRLDLMISVAAVALSFVVGSILGAIAGYWGGWLDAILNRFLKVIAGCDALWTPANIVEDIISSVRERVGESRVILGLSGGVDSSVVAALLSRAIGDQLTCVFVDNGLLRLNEAEQVQAMLGKDSDNTFRLNIVAVDASEKFLDKLEDIEDPEAKRKIIGNTFIDVFDEEAHRIEDVRFLAQGTIYPDVIESAGNDGSKAHVIKSHHNVGGLPDYMKLELVEPLRELFKDEVRKIGLELGLSHEVVFRHPFPGPGLGVRILGPVTKEYADLLREADAIYIDELRKADLYDKVSQAFAVFLPVKSVGVVGDARRYEYVIALRAVETIDFMTARWAHLPYDFLERVSSRIINEINGISRVTYDISSKPPATIEWE